MFGIVQETHKPITGSFPKFGLNQNCTLKEVTIKDGNLDFSFDVDGCEVGKRFFKPGKVFAKTGGEITDVNSQEYKTGLEEQNKEFCIAVNHIVYAIIGVDAWHNIVKQGFPSYEEYCSVVIRTLQPFVNKAKVDLFLQYPWTRREGKRKFLELPKTTKYGSFCVKSDGLIYAEQRTGSTLTYVSGEKQHPFIRGKWFLESEFANPGKEVEVTTPGEDVLPF